MDDIVNRSPDEVKEREFETTGYKGGTDLPSNPTSEGGNVDSFISGNREFNKGKESTLPDTEQSRIEGYGSINDAMEEGTEIKPNHPYDATAGIP